MNPRPRAPEPVKLLAAVLYREEEALAAARRSLERRWGPIDFEGAAHRFDRTSYYQEEMGADLRRRFLSFLPLVSPGALAEAKLAAIEVEDGLRGDSGRRINIDAGYLDLHKLVLASVKPGPMKVFLERGVYADLVARYSQGRFHPVDWTFEDFRRGLYDPELLEIRRRYREQLGRGGGMA